MKVKLSRKRDYRNMLIRNLATSLILHEQITTTSAKAKSLKSFTNKLITIAKKDSLESKRKIASILLDHNAKVKIYEDILPRLEKGTDFVQVIANGNRLGDGSKTSKVILLLKPVLSKDNTNKSKQTRQSELNEQKDEN